ncbi:4-hydroxy-3-methylbut-2-enyl diphosphate reductase [Planctomycetota bacterium]
MKVTLASALGTCFGVRSAIEAALDAKYANDLTIIGDLVHNPQTVAKLKEHGVRFVDSLDDPIHTKNVMITAHGAPQSVTDRARDMGYTVHDASCPLVKRVHDTVKDLVAEGYFPVVFGEAKHVEIRGIVGRLDEYAIVGSIEDFGQLAGKEKVGIVCQTTHQLQYAQELLKAMTSNFPGMEIKFIDTICKPTKDRQKAVRDLAAKVDLMIVVGGHNSSNTKKLKKVCQERNLTVYQIEAAGEIDPGWFAGCNHIGITAGTSTPAEVIQEVHDRIRNL